MSATRSNLPKQRWGSLRFDTGAFGLGFHEHESDEFQAIRKDLVEALDRSFWRANPERVKDLLGRAQSNSAAFVAIIDDGGRSDGLPNYAHEPIFSDFDPTEAAQFFFSLEPEITCDILRPFERRVLRLESDPNAEHRDKRSERAWLLKVRNAAIDLASKADPIRDSPSRVPTDVKIA
ncbi:MAG: hypothetical protein ACK446_06195 [Rhodobacterales bacterium]|jgi:hypothetical protein